MRIHVCLAASALGAGMLMADTISPAMYSTTLNVGGTATIKKTVTVSQQSTAPVDVMFLADTTGSMGSALSSVQSGFGSIVSSLAPLASNINYGVGDYKDEGSTNPYLLRQDLTSNLSDVQSALDNLSASGGGDYPEANLYALNQAATTSSWRAGSQRFLVWVGDAPGHDPRLGISEAAATAALVAANIMVFGIDVGGLDDTGQATRITDATGGQLLAGGYSEAATIIQNALTTTILNYATVELGVTAPAGVGVSFSPSGGFSGVYDRSISRTFNFDVTFTGLAPGTYTFDVNALVDGVVASTERDTVTVTRGTAIVPEPSTWAMMASAIGALGFVLRRRSL